VDMFLGLKPQAESCSPFGTKPYSPQSDACSRLAIPQ
jgi:hypothetical protein